MSDNGSPPHEDPGGLDLYSMNADTHKLAELVADNQSSANNCLASDSSFDAIYNSLQLQGSTLDIPSHVGADSATGESFLEIEPSNFNNSANLLSHDSMYYFSGVDETQTTGSHYNHTLQSHIFPSNGGYKNSTDVMGGYIDMLSHSDNLSQMPVTRETINYNVPIVSSNSHSQQLPFLPTTSASEWHCYNQMNGNSILSAGNSHHDGMCNFQSTSSGQYHSNMPFSSTSSMLPPLCTNQNISSKILTADWNRDVLLKAQLFSDTSSEPSSSKHCKIEPGTQVSKGVRGRKKSADIGRHSKAVATSMLSEKAPSLSNALQSQEDKNIIDSSTRNKLVTKLMDNICSTVQYESFCLSFPRSNVKDNAFYKKVCTTAALVNSIESKYIQSEPFPSSNIEQASKVLMGFNAALKKRRGKGSCNDDSFTTDDKNISFEQVEEKLPHSFFWVIKMCNKTLTANWEGQFVATVNPVENKLSISVFHFQPSFSSKGKTSLQQQKLTNDLAREIVDNMEQFEVSRQLRCDINLMYISQIYLYKPSENNDESCLILETYETPKFYQRWLHTSAENKNKWSRRGNFFSQDKWNAPLVICIGGLLSEANELVALMLACNNKLKEIYEKSTETPFLSNYQINDSSYQFDEIGAKEENDNKTSMIKSGRRLGSNAIKLRNEIVEVLRSHNITENKMNSHSRLENDSSDSLWINLDENLCGCFIDYVNYSCNSATDLNAILHKIVDPGAYEKDFNLTVVPHGNINQLTVGELVSTKCSDVVYFSFCKNELKQIGHNQHCAKCHACWTSKFWHCGACNRCSKSKSVCTYCGHLRVNPSRVVIKPLSVFRSQVDAGTSLGGMKEQWIAALNQEDNDELYLEPPHIVHCVETMEYNSENAMEDQLGLLDPFGFLVGLKLSGTLRKHRDAKKNPIADRIMQSSKKAGQLQSDCSMQ